MRSAIASEFNNNLLTIGGLYDASFGSTIEKAIDAAMIAIGDFDPAIFDPLNACTLG